MEWKIEDGWMDGESADREHDELVYARWDEPGDEVVAKPSPVTIVNYQNILIILMTVILLSVCFIKTCTNPILLTL